MPRKAFLLPAFTHAPRPTAFHGPEPRACMQPFWPRWKKRWTQAAAPCATIRAPKASPARILKFMLPCMIAKTSLAALVARRYARLCKASVPRFSALNVSAIDDLARVHQNMRIQRTLDLAHERQLPSGHVERQLVFVQPPNAMFGASGAAKRVHAIMHHLIDLRLQLQQCGLVRTFRSSHVVMQIAIAQIADNNVAHTRECSLQLGVGLLDKIGH